MRQLAIVATMSHSGLRQNSYCKDSAKYMRIICFIYLAALLFSTSSRTLHAQSYPDRPVKIVVPYGPGGGSDIVIRAIQANVSGSLGQPIVIENKPGASSTLGTDLVAKSTPDGYTMLVVDMAILVNPSLFTKLPYDTLKDLQPVIFLASTPSIMLISSKLGIKNLKELIASARAQPGKLSYGSAGFGTGGHMASEMLKIVTGVDLIHIPYKGAGPAMADALGGHVTTMFTTTGAAKGVIESGQMIGLGITSDKRVESLGQVPTFLELGYPDINASITWGIFLPTGTAKEVIQKINSAFNMALQAPDSRQRLIDLGFMPGGGTSQAWSHEVSKSIQRWSAIVKQANIRVE